MRKHKEIEEIFRDNIVNMIKGAFINNPNYNNYYYNDIYSLTKHIKWSAQLILDDIASTEHLILDNGVKELQAELLEAYKAIIENTKDKDPLIKAQQYIKENKDE